jgi:hypothetical protein
VSTLSCRVWGHMGAGPLLRHVRTLLVASILAAGCSNQPGRILQLCLGDEQAVGEFKEVLQQIAQESGMRYVDGSSETARKLQVLGQAQGFELIHIGLRGQAGDGLTVGNQGLSAHEVAIGFPRTQDPAQSEFERDVIRWLEQRWQVHRLPDNRGAFPLPGCAGPPAK